MLHTKQKFLKNLFVWWIENRPGSEKSSPSPVCCGVAYLLGGLYYRCFHGSGVIINGGSCTDGDDSIVRDSWDAFVCIAIGISCGTF